MGVAAVETVISELRGTEPEKRQWLLPPTLVARESTRGKA
jgi:DNA-binding LacI/PurR family transcriptional regulator